SESRHAPLLACARRLPCPAGGRVGRRAGRLRTGRQADPQAALLRLPRRVAAEGQAAPRQRHAHPQGGPQRAPRPARPRRPRPPPPGPPPPPHNPTPGPREEKPRTKNKPPLPGGGTARAAPSPADDAPETAPRNHWAFKKPVRPAVPVVKNAAWVGNPI